MIPTQQDNKLGLHIKYNIQKIVNDQIVPIDKNAEYFVLRLDEGGDPEHIKACRISINSYANAIEHYLPILANDLRERYPIIK